MRNSDRGKMSASMEACSKALEWPPRMPCHRKLGWQFLSWTLSDDRSVRGWHHTLISSQRYPIAGLCMALKVSNRTLYSTHLRTGSQCNDFNAGETSLFWSRDAQWVIFCLNICMIKPQFCGSQRVNRHCHYQQPAPFALLLWLLCQ
jgi:hypothetical protein